jgi:carboxyl-terminal processing protease
MNKKIQVWLPLLFAIVMIAGMFIGYKLRDNMPSRKSMLRMDKKTSLQEVIDLISIKYVDSVRTDTLVDEAIEEILSRLDPHSVYIPTSLLSEVNEDLQGNFEGIGVEFNIFNDTIHVINVLQNGPSDKAGLKVGDRFLKVNDSVVAGTQINTDRIKKLLRGKRGTEVQVTMMRAEGNKVFMIKRGTIPLPSVDAGYMIDNTTGYIRINKFAETTYEEFMATLERLQKGTLQKLMLDLRGNGGGLLEEAVDIADEFLDGNKLIVSVKGNHNPLQEKRAKRAGLFEKGKLVLLLDEGSASASEVLAGALQDHDRATIIGRRSFGKGLVQEQYQLSDGAALRLTVARYYTPSGRSIQKPWDHGMKDYNAEVLERYHNGALVNADSNKVGKGQAYKTDEGKTVYGGGGIMPDVFVPFDTTSFDKSIAQLYQKGIVNNFIYTYYISHAGDFKQYAKPGDMMKGFSINDNIWNALIGFAAKDSIDIRSVKGKDREMLSARLKSLFARQLWRMEGYYEISNSNDPVVKKGLEVISK